MDSATDGTIHATNAPARAQGMSPTAWCGGVINIKTRVLNLQATLQRSDRSLDLRAGRSPVGALPGVATR